MPLLISFEIWHWASWHRRDKVKKKSCLKYFGELAVEQQAGRERGEQRKAGGAAARAIGRVCSPGSLCVLFLQRAPDLYRGQTLTGQWAQSKAWAKKQAGCCQLPLLLLMSARALFHTLAQQDLLIRYDKQHSWARLAGFQLTFQERGRVLPLCEHTLIKLWFLSEHFINPGSAVCQKSQRVEYANVCSLQLLMLMYLCPQCLLCFTLGCIFYVGFLLLYCLPLHRAREMVGALCNCFALPSFAQWFWTGKVEKKEIINMFLLPKLLFSPYAEHIERHWMAANYS